MPKIKSKKTSFKEEDSLQVNREWNKLSSLYLPFSPIVHYFVSFSYPATNCSGFPDMFYLNLNIYREFVIKALIKEKNGDVYKLISKVHFDGRYYRVKCVHFGEWEYCWELAVRIQFFGMVQGLAFEPKKIVSKNEKKIIYKFLVLVNPYELWEQKLVERLWNLQDRIEFLIAKILFHECIHILIFLGKTLPSDFKQTNIFLEFKEMFEFANSEELCPESCDVQFHLQNLANLGSNFPESSKERLDQISELYEFLINEKYSIKKTDLAFGLSWSNRKISQDYAKVTASKIGFYKNSDKKLLKREINRLNQNLERLYDRIDCDQVSDD
jgi:hypothetical protein